jgi:hypothetical protein
MTSQRPPSVYRLHVSPASEDRNATFKYLLDHHLVGMGWGAGQTDHDWESYKQVAQSDEWYAEVNPSVRALRDASTGALVWMRDLAGAYYLARITGPWLYINDDVNAKLDLWNASLWESLNGQPPSYAPTLDDVLSALLGAQDLEDLVAVYLQRVYGYLALPASRRPDTPAYEYVLRHPDSGDEAVVQVKTGTSPVPRDRGSLPTRHVGRVFVFSPSGSYSGRRAANVVELQFDDLVRFMREQPTCLPPLVEHWTRMAEATK